MLMRNDPAGLAVSETPTDRLHDVEVVQHVVEAAVVWQTIEERSNSIFGRHRNLRKDGPEYTTAAVFSQVLEQVDSLVGSAG